MAIDRTILRRESTLPRSEATLRTAENLSSSLKIQMLSTFRVAVNGQELNGRLNGKARALLKILAAHRDRVLARDALMEMVWPDTDPATGSISLKVTAHNLRVALEPAKPTGTPSTWILFRDGTYYLDRDSAVWIDIEEIDRLWRVGRQAESHGDAEGARVAYRGVEALYTGDFLEEDIYDDWTTIRREQLRDMYLDAISRLADFAVMNGDHRDAIRYCHKIIDTDPCREDAYRVLMSSHGALNQRARAGAWYAVCRTLLKREMGVGPASDTVKVFESLFRDDAERSE